MACLPTHSRFTITARHAGFLSYAHTPADERLAFYIESRLCAAGVGVWMDTSSLNAGQPTRQAIQDAAAGSDHGVFIVSPLWLTRDWTEWELGLFEARDPGLVRHRASEIAQ